MHCDEPFVEYVPVGHKEQFVIDIAPEFGEYDPAAQLVHEADVLALHVPGMHAMQLLADDYPVRELADPAEQLLQIGEPALEY
jgi:hypothetical protein